MRKKIIIKAAGMTQGAGGTEGANTQGGTSFWSQLSSGSDSGSGSMMGEGPYAFGTLWKEATRAVGYVMKGFSDAAINRNNNSAANFQTYWMLADKRADKLTNNTGFYLIIGLIIVAVAAIFITKNIKS